MTPHRTTVLKTELGTVYVDWNGCKLEEIRFGEEDRQPTCQMTGPRVSGGEEETMDLLERYFQGERVEFPVLDLSCFSPFQQDVWQTVRSIPYGRTESYGGIAKRLGRPYGARAVGAALGQNPFPPLVPCHRVVSTSGDLTGFAYGLGWQRALLDLDQPQGNLF